MDNKHFWENHYKEFTNLSPSAFCLHCMDKVLSEHDTLIELGSGNGRDGLELAHTVNKYIGFDSCPTAIDLFGKAIEQSSLSPEKVILKVGDFTSFDFNQLLSNRIAIYGRFSLHAIDYASQSRLLNNLELLNTSDWICMIEARTIADELYGVGTEVGKHEFVTDHYRRFIDPKEFLSQILERFEVSYFEVSKGFAMYKGDDPTVMRIVFKGAKHG